jgi:hypothetical protein
MDTVVTGSASAIEAPTPVINRAIIDDRLRPATMPCISFYSRETRSRTRRSRGRVRVPIAGLTE